MFLENFKDEVALFHLNLSSILLLSYLLMKIGQYLIFIVTRALQLNLTLVFFRQLYSVLIKFTLKIMQNIPLYKFETATLCNM